MMRYDVYELGEKRPYSSCETIEQAKELADRLAPREGWSLPYVKDSMDDDIVVYVAPPKEYGAKIEDYPYTYKDVVKITGMSLGRVQQGARQFAVKFGSEYRWSEEALARFKERIGKRGRPKQENNP